MESSHPHDAIPTAPSSPTALTPASPEHTSDTATPSSTTEPPPYTLPPTQQQPTSITTTIRLSRSSLVPTERGAPIQPLPTLPSTEESHHALDIPQFYEELQPDDNEPPPPYTKDYLPSLRLLSGRQYLDESVLDDEVRGGGRSDKMVIKRMMSFAILLSLLVIFILWGVFH